VTGVDVAERDDPAGVRRLSWPAVVGIGVVVLVVLLPLRGLLRTPGPPMEEGFMLVFPERVLRGDIPNKDFLHLYGPGSLWVLAGVYKVFGVSLWSERIVAYLQLVGIVFGMLAVLRPFGWRVAATGAVITGVVVIPPIGLSALAWNGAVALGLGAVAAGTYAGRLTHGGDDRRAARWALGAGLLAGFALLYRPDLIIALALGAAAIGWRLGSPARKRLALGAAIGAAPYLVHVAMAGIGNVIEGMIIEPVFELRGGRRLPLPPSPDQFDGFLQRAGVLLRTPWALPAPPGPAQLGLWLLLLLGATAFVVVVAVRAVRRDRTSSTAHALLAGALFGVGLLPQAFQRVDSAHLAWVSCVAFGLLPAAVVTVLRQYAPRLGETRRVVVAGALPVLMLVAVIPYFTVRDYTDYVAESFGQHRGKFTVRRGDRSFIYGREDAGRAYQEMIPDVERVSEPGDRLFVGTGDLRKTPYSEAFIYYLFPELPPATRYIEMDPGVANADDSGMAEELEGADIVILSTIRDDWYEPNDSRLFGPDEPNQIIARDFCMVGSYGKGIPPERGVLELYERC
jgi:hypothetical protein